MNALSPGLQSLFSLVVGLMVVTALVLLWRRDRTPWLLVALVGESLGLAFRVALTALPDLVRAVPMLFSLWTLTALAFAIGLLGYAIDTTARRTP